MTQRTYGSGRSQRSELAKTGPIIDVTLRGEDSQFAGIMCRGLIDTGATAVCIDQRIAERANLRYFNDTNLGVVGGPDIPAKMYGGYVIVPELKFEHVMPIFAVRMRHQEHNVLLGRSFLQHFVVTFNGPEGMFHFWRPEEDSPEDDYAT